MRLRRLFALAVLLALLFGWLMPTDMGCFGRIIVGFDPTVPPPQKASYRPWE